MNARQLIAAAFPSVPRHLRALAEQAARAEDDALTFVEDAAQWCSGMHCKPPTLLRSWDGSKYVTATCKWCGEKGETA